MLFEGKCPECQSQMELLSYIGVCPKCRFTACREGKGLDLSPKEIAALLLLASHAGKVILVYAKIKGIPHNNTNDIMADSAFSKKEYHALLTLFNQLAVKAEKVLLENYSQMIQEIRTELELTCSDKKGKKHE